MELSGPQTVQQGLRGAFMASGCAGAESVLIEMGGANVGYDRIYLEGRSACTYGARMDNEGETTIRAFAEDKAGNTLGEATFTFRVVKAQGAARAGGPGAGGGYIVDAPRQVEAMEPWTYTISGLKNVHSVLVELYGANGGMFRLFPRGRDAMQHAFVPQAPGRTQVVMFFRDAQLRTMHMLAGEIEVAPHVVGGPGAGGGYEPAASVAPMQPMGPAKPPMAFAPMDGLSPYAAGGMAQSGSMAPLKSSGPSFAPKTMDELMKQKEAELLKRLSKKP